MRGWRSVREGELVAAEYPPESLSIPSLLSLTRLSNVSPSRSPLVQPLLLSGLAFPTSANEHRFHLVAQLFFYWPLRPSSYSVSSPLLVTSSSGRRYSEGVCKPDPPNWSVRFDEVERVSNCGAGLWIVGLRELGGLVSWVLEALVVEFQ